MLLPETFFIFKKLIPFAILLSVLALFFFHSHFQKNDLIAFVSIYILGFAAEVIGVNTGIIFGNYNYGESLGIELFNTPLMIGINWLLLIYISSSVARKLKINATLQILVASLIMLGYDLIIEQVSPVLDMWSWLEGNVPVKNYIAWFLLALLFHSILKILNVETKNKLAPVILFCQLSFFIVLLLFFKL
nr:carotenoid biosynthesis protein [Maribellus maritimus]